jgi:hypothetical protein
MSRLKILASSGLLCCIAMIGVGAHLRATHRAELIDGLARAYADLPEYADIDPALVGELSTLLVDQEFQRRARLRRRMLPVAPEVEVTLNRRYIDEVRELLGPAGFERYQEFNANQRQRQMVEQVEQRLSPADQLTAAQKKQLLSLFIEQHRRGMVVSQAALILPAEQQFVTATRLALQSAKGLDGRAASFLTAKQLMALSQTSHEIQRTRRSVTTLRVEGAISDAASP